MALPFYNWSRTAASNSTADATVNWAEGMAPSAVNDSGRAMMASTAAFRDDTAGAITTGGSSTAYTLSTYQVFDSLAHLNGQEIAFTPHATSGATPTLAVDGLTAKPIRSATGVALPTGTLLSGSVYRTTYNNSSGEFLLHNQPGVLPANSVATATVADAAVTYAKIQNVAGSRLLGNPTGSGAAPSEISLGAGLSFSGTTLVANPAAAQNYLSGLTLSTAGNSTTMTVAAGVANDSTNISFMTLASDISKTMASWSAGTGNGGLDTGSIASNTWYHFYEIMRPDTGVVDVIFSTSASSPTLPTNYTLYRRVGSGFSNASSKWASFAQFGDEFLWLSPQADIATTTLSGVPTNFTLTVPTGVRVFAEITGIFSNATLGTMLLIQSPDVTGAGPNLTTGLATCRVVVAGVASAFVDRIRTDTSAQIVAYAAASNSTLNVSTKGWIDLRGKT